MRFGRATKHEPVALLDGRAHPTGTNVASESADPALDDAELGLHDRGRIDSAWLEDEEAIVLAHRPESVLCSRGHRGEGEKR